jgi:hypothetical protein
MQLLGIFSMRRFGPNLLLIYFVVVALALFLLVLLFSPQFSAAATITSALRKSYDWGTSPLPTPTGYQNSIPPWGEQIQDEKDRGTGMPNGPNGKTRAGSVSVVI